MYSILVTTFGVFATFAATGAVVLGGLLASNAGRSLLGRTLEGQGRHPLVWAWLVALLAMAGSLYLSEVADLLPCSLCWYQRIAMYPLVVILGVGALRADLSVWRYGLPLSVIGLVIAAYHVTIQWRPALDIGACSVGAPCSGRYLAVFGFISIPTMAGAMFLLISTLLLLVRELDTPPSAPVSPI